MSFNAKEVPITGGTRQESLEPGGYPARVVTVANLGMHIQEYQGKVKDPKHLIGMTYELLDEFLKDEDGLDLEDKPRWQSETFSFNNLTNDRAKSTLRYKALDPTEEHDGDFSSLLSMPCMVNLIKKKGTGANAGKEFNNVDGISPMRPREAAKAPELVNTPVLFDFYSPTESAWAGLSPRFRKLATEAVDYPGSALEELVRSLETKPETKEDKAPKKEKKKTFTAPVEDDDDNKEDKDW
jgi:hypothetical protein